MATKKRVRPPRGPKLDQSKVRAAAFLTVATRMTQEDIGEQVDLPTSDVGAALGYARELGILSSVSCDELHLSDEEIYLLHSTYMDQRPSSDLFNDVRLVLVAPAITVHRVAAMRL